MNMYSSIKSEERFYLPTMPCVEARAKMVAAGTIRRLGNCIHNIIITETSSVHRSVAPQRAPPLEEYFFFDCMPCAHLVIIVLVLRRTKQQKAGLHKVLAAGRSRFEQRT